MTGRRLALVVDHETEAIRWLRRDDTLDFTELW
jgi:hypothetical protein